MGVQSLASTDPERADEYAQRLRVPDYSHFDPEELEAVPIPKLQVKKQEDNKESSEAANTKKRRKRAVRYPKGYDPAKPGPMPDPERWLPKRERSDYKKNKKDNLFRGPQGSTVADDAALGKKGPSTAQVEASKDDSKPRNTNRKKGGKK